MAFRRRKAFFIKASEVGKRGHVAGIVSFFFARTNRMMKMCVLNMRNRTARDSVQTENRAFMEVVMTENPVLEIRNVSKVIDGRRIIDSVSLEVHPGEVMGILGPNGAGKTTLIRMTTGLVTPTRGEILIRGNSVQSRFEQAIRHVGAIVENPEFYPFLTGYKNLLHFARMVPGVSEKRIREVISLVKLEKAVHDPVKTYSLGMRQRLGLAQAILHRPTLLILDEPTNGLDPAGIRELRDYLRHLAETEKAAVLVSSHLLSEMELMCDRVAVLKRGKLIGVRRMSEILRRDSGEVQTRFEVDRMEQVPSILLRMGFSREWKKCPGGFEIRLRREETAELNRRLIEAGICVYAIHRREQSLEERFLEMTEGEKP